MVNEHKMTKSNIQTTAEYAEYAAKYSKCEEYAEYAKKAEYEEYADYAKYGKDAIYFLFRFSPNIFLLFPLVLHLIHQNVMKSKSNVSIQSCGPV